MNPNTNPSPTISTLAGALRRHETSAAELLAESLRRIRKDNPVLNAFAVVDEAGAREAARAADEEMAAGIDRGPLHGVPVAVKDLIDVAGLPTTCGSATSFGATATRDAEVVRRLRRSGAVIVGKTTLHEFAYGATGDRSVHGASRNPRDPSRISGGSSGGSAVAVAAGMVPLSVGTDTAGSVRVPAALCGVVGFKPAYDAVPTEGVYPLAPTLDHVGLFAQTTEDVQLGYQALIDGFAESRPRAEDGLTVGWIPPRDIATTDPRMEELTQQALARAGFTLSPVHGFPRGHREQSLFKVFSTLQGREAFQVHEHHLEKDHDRIDTEVLARLRRGREISSAHYARAEEARRELLQTVARLLRTHSVLALPTTPIVAPPLDARTVRVAETNLEVRTALLSLTSPWNMTGMPAISVPAGQIDGLPAAVQLVTAPDNLHLMFAVAKTLEAAQRPQPSAP
ncbi:amidase [Streptomyces bathyalis]|uniref:Amidase n=1 Tax=Streptomyces bathyalis TaxID=2710756 RepID=A0A7T1WQL3_9ACTN|nr:amidase [Streptomyces bathyalis]QPP05321.1 amidase [Streptomyces bathyalis]